MADRKRILVAEDDLDLLELLRTEFTAQGYETLTAVDGKEALRVALAEKPDLILLDVMMPHIDGYHVASEVTSKLGPESPHIIIMTGRDTIREQGIAMMSGAHEVVQKPFAMADLRRRVAAALG
ncbi:MAG: response regulator [Elusimicrobia bacterium]|nr:response regulator [Elusimicrobiota bacterium]